MDRDIAVQIDVFTKAQNTVVVSGCVDMAARVHCILDRIDLEPLSFMCAIRDKFAEH